MIHSKQGVELFIAELMFAIRSHYTFVYNSQAWCMLINLIYISHSQTNLAGRTDS